MKYDVDLSIIIVNYNTRELLAACLQSVQKARRDHMRWEIMVVDNASTDGSSEMVQKEFPDVQLLVNKTNVGFSAGNNAGIKHTSGRLVLLLNSDTQVGERTIAAMVDFMDKNPGVGVATCKLVLPDGDMDPACHRGFPTPWASFTYMVGLEKLLPRSRLFGQYHQRYNDLTKPHEIDSPSGAFFLVRREVIRDVGLLDEAYFMYGEDLDWAYRMKEKGWKIMFYPEVWALHRKRQSGRANGDETVRIATERYFYQTMKLFYQKHYQHRYSPILTRLIRLVITARIFCLTTRKI